MATQKIQVLSPNLPVTIGVPFRPSDNLLNTNNLRVKDPSGAVIAGGSAFEVLVRQFGLKTDTTKPIWNALVSFKPTTAGEYTIDDSAAAYTPAPMTVTNNASDIRVQAGTGVDITLNKSNAELASSFKIGAGAEILHATNRPKWRIPVTVYSGRSQVTTRANAGQANVVVEDGTAFTVGQQVKFYFSSTITVYYSMDSSGHPAIVMPDRYGEYIVTETPDREFVIARGTGAEQNVLADWIGPTPTVGQLFLVNPPPTTAPLPGQTIEDKDLLDDFAANGAYTITDITGNTITLDRNLPLPILQYTTMELTAGASSSVTTADFTPSTTTIVRNTENLVVVEQFGFFKNGATTIFPFLEGTIWWWFYKDQPWVRVYCDLRNKSDNNNVAATDITIDEMYFIVPTATAGSGSDSVMSSATAIARTAAGTQKGTIAADTFKLSVPEFSDNWPKGLLGNASGLRFDVFPSGSDEIFPRDRGYSFEFYLGTDADVATAVTDSLNATLDPAYVISTGLYRAATSAKPTTPYTAAQLGGDTEMANAANGAEKLLACAYDPSVVQAYGSRPAATIKEFREWDYFYPASYGWKQFGLLSWGSNPNCYNHYDLEFHLVTEFLRSKHGNAFKYASQGARKMASWGTFQSRDLINGSEYLQNQGLHFYEDDTRRGDPGDGRPCGFPSHSWHEGGWAYWALTGDFSVLKSCLLTITSKDQIGATVPGVLHNYNWGPAGSGLYPGAWLGNTTVNSLDTLELNDGSRWVGWAILNLLAAYRFHGDPTHLTRAQQYTNCFVAGEVAQGSKGYYMAASMSSADPTPTSLDAAPASFVWAGYVMVGIIELYKLTGSPTIRDFIVRVADHVLKGDATAATPTPNALYQGGATWTPTGQYRPVDMLYRFWQGADTTLNAALSNVATTFTVTNGSKIFGPGVATESPAYLIITDGTDIEVVSYTGRSGNSVTGVTRARFGTTARNWSAGATVGAGAFTDGFGGVRAAATLSDIFLPLFSTASKISGRSDLANAAKRIFKDVGLYRGVPGPMFDPSAPGNAVVPNFIAYGVAGSAVKTYGQTAFAIEQYFADVLSNPIPVISTLSQNSATAGTTNLTVTITGTGFLLNSQAKVNGVNRTTAFVDATHITVVITTADMATAGTLSITVENPQPGGGTSNALTFTVSAAANPAPTLSSVSPTSAVAGGAQFTLTVNGANFDNDAVVRWNGNNLTTTYVSATQLTAVVPASFILTAGSASVTVRNVGDGVETAPLTFTISAAPNPLPTLASIAPQVATVGAAQFTLTVNGANFINGSVVRWGAQSLTTTFVSANQLTAIVPASLLTAVGTVNVTVFTPAPGGGTTAAQTFSINAAPQQPTISSVSPATFQQNGPTATLTINGASLTNASVTFKGTALTKTSNTATQIVVTVPATLLTVAGVFALVVTTTDGSVTRNMTVVAPAGPSPGYIGVPTDPAGNDAYTVTVIGPTTIITDADGVATGTPTDTSPNSTYDIPQTAPPSNPPWDVGYVGTQVDPAGNEPYTADGA